MAIIITQLCEDNDWIYSNSGNMADISSHNDIISNIKTNINDAGCLVVDITPIHTDSEGRRIVNSNVMFEIAWALSVMNEDNIYLFTMEQNPDFKTYPFMINHQEIHVLNTNDSTDFTEDLTKWLLRKSNEYTNEPFLQSYAEKIFFKLSYNDSSAQVNDKEAMFYITFLDRQNFNVRKNLSLLCGIFDHLLDRLTYDNSYPKLNKYSILAYIKNLLIMVTKVGKIYKNIINNKLIHKTKIQEWTNTFKEILCKSDMLDEGLIMYLWKKYTHGLKIDKAITEDFIEQLNKCKNNLSFILKS